MGIDLSLLNQVAPLSATVQNLQNMLKAVPSLTSMKVMHLFNKTLTLIKRLKILMAVQDNLQELNSPLYTGLVQDPGTSYTFKTGHKLD